LPVFDSIEHGYVRALVDLALPLAMEVGAAVLLYTAVPNVRVVWRDALIGSLFAAILLEIAKRLFAASMKYFTSYQILYGAIAALPVFLLWVYISWVIILLGAIVTATLDEQRAARASRAA